MDNCHLCGNKLFPEPVLQIKGMPKAAQYYPEKDEFAEDKSITLIIQQCPICGLVQHNLKPVEYFKEVITAASLSEKSRLSRLNQMKEFVDRFELAGKKVLEIGSGKGEMLDVLEETGMKATGLEASSKSVETGKSLGRKMIQGYIGDINAIEGSPFDAFVSFNYLEHLPEPGRIIKNIYNNTAADSMGFITVPNFEYLLKTKCFYEFVADHISYFTKKTLTYALEANGFDVLECQTINEENDIAAIVKKRKALNLSEQYSDVDSLIKNLRHIIADYKSKNKKIAVWGAGHRTLALLALSGANDIEYIIDSAKFKQGKFTPILHLEIMPPEYLKKKEIDLVIIMVPGLYPGEVLKTLKQMDIGAEVAMLRENKIEFIKFYKNKNMEMTNREKENRTRLQEKKPLAYAKIIKHPEKIKNKESVALVQLQYKYNCNFRCKHCAIERFKQQNGRLLSIADVKRIADQADAMGLASICISGGEPLIFPDLKDVIKAIGPDRFVISMDTNGWFLTEEKVKWLVENGVDRIHLSIDGLEANHDEFRKAKGAWKRCIDALDCCKKHGLGVVINIVVTKSLISSGELIRQLDFLAKYGQHTSLIFAKATGAFEQYKDEILDSKDINYIQTLHQQLGGKYNTSSHLSPNCGFELGCMCFKRHFSITAHGDVLPCPWIPIKFGNIFDEDLETIVKRGLGVRWFSYDHKFSCLSGNRDTFFYKNIMPQIEQSDTYPVDWRKIQWEIQNDEK